MSSREDVSEGVGLGARFYSVSADHEHDTVHIADLSDGGHEVDVSAEIAQYLSDELAVAVADLHDGPIDHYPSELVVESGTAHYEWFGGDNPRVSVFVTAFAQEAVMRFPVSDVEEHVRALRQAAALAKQHRDDPGF